MSGVKVDHVFHCLEKRNLFIISLTEGKKRVDGTTTFVVKHVNNKLFKLQYV